MFTNNFITYMKQFALGSNQSYKVADGSSKTSRNTAFWDAGFIKWMGKANCREILATHTTSASNTMADHLVSPGIYFGAGSTPASKSDHTLASPITTGLSLTVGTPYLTSRDDVYTYKVCHVARNHTDAEINIYEIGLFVPIEINGDTSRLKWYNILIERTVLSSPITILPGEAKAIEYSITFNQKLNVE